MDGGVVSEDLVFDSDICPQAGCTEYMIRDTGQLMTFIHIVTELHRVGS